MPQERKSYWNYIAGLLLFGSNGIVASGIALDSYKIVYLRCIIGITVLLLLFLLTRQKRNVKGYERDLCFLAISGATMGGNWLFLYEAYQQIGVGTASLLCYCGPVIVMALAPILFHEKLTLHKCLGFLVVLVGVFLINGQAAQEGKTLWGLFCGGMSAVMLREGMSLLRLLGVGCILGGAMLAEMSGKKTRSSFSE